MSVDFSELQGSVILSLSMIDNDKVYISTSRGILKLYHVQDCCESVYLGDVIGDPNLLIGHVIQLAEERIQDESSLLVWTFYEIVTNSETLTLRWVGSSNGYYSMWVDMKWVESIPEGAVPLRSPDA